MSKTILIIEMRIHSQATWRENSWSRRRSEKNLGRKPTLWMTWRGLGQFRYRPSRTWRIAWEIMRRPRTLSMSCRSWTINMSGGRRSRSWRSICRTCTTRKWGKRILQRGKSRIEIKRARCSPFYRALPLSQHQKQKWRSITPSTARATTATPSTLFSGTTISSSGLFLRTPETSLPWPQTPRGPRTRSSSPLSQGETPSRPSTGRNPRSHQPLSPRSKRPDWGRSPTSHSTWGSPSQRGTRLTRNLRSENSSKADNL